MRKTRTVPGFCDLPRGGFPEKVRWGRAQEDTDSSNLSGIKHSMEEHCLVMFIIVQMFLNLPEPSPETSLIDNALLHTRLTQSRQTHIQLK